MLTDVARRRIPIPATDIELAVIDWGGDGPLALLHHANGFCAGLWGLVAEGLRSRFRVVAMDARGHGDSDKPVGREAYAWRNFGLDAAAVAETLAAEYGPVALGLGHSFGGTALCLAAIERPGLFGCLVLLDPIVFPSGMTQPPEGSSERKVNLADGARRRRHDFDSREQAHRAWNGRAIFTNWDPRALDLYLAEGLADREDGRVELKCPGEVEATIFEGGGSVDVMGMADRLAAPTLIAWARDGNFPRSHFETLASRMPQGEVITAEAGHLIPMEDPDWVVETVAAFSARSGTRAGSSPSSPPGESAPS